VEKLLDEPKPFINVMFTEHYYDNSIVTELKEQTLIPLNVKDYDNDDDHVLGKHLCISLKL
jgi:hypothetical protein